MKVLNLYAGIGGNRKLWEDVEVTAVELVSEIARIYQDFFPDDTVIVADAHEYLLEHYKEFDLIWSSPPCTTHTRMNKNFANTKNGIGQINPRYPDMKLYQEIIFLHHFFKGQFCVENVLPYYGNQLGLIIPDLYPQQRHRHLYWCNFKINTTDKSNPPKQIKNLVPKRKARKNFIKVDEVETLAQKLGFDVSKLKNIYNGNNHSPAQYLRNCVDPKEGLHILDCACNIIRNKTTQASLFN
jgi:DNA (cytosine-5)-methyltransferase 1